MKHQTPSPPKRRSHAGVSARIVSAYLCHNRVEPWELAAMLAKVHSTIASLAEGHASGSSWTKEPSVPIHLSVTPDHIACLEDGLKYKSLRRHLRAAHGLTPDEYRAKWGLPKNYPMAAPAHAANRSRIARGIGLGKGSNKRPGA